MSLALTNTGDLPSDKFDKLIEWQLLSLLMFMPLAFGGVEAWSEEVIISLAGTTIVCFCLKLIFRPDTRLVWSRSYLPIGLFILIVIIQLIPLPVGLIKFVSPSTSIIKQELLGDLPNSNELLKSMTFSFYSNATKHSLRLVLAVAAVFFVVRNTCRSAEQIKRLLAAVAVIGSFIAVLALAQGVFGNGKIYWLVSTGYNRSFSGTFINHSHYSQYMSLSIGAAVGLVMVKLHEAFLCKQVTLLAVLEYLFSHAAGGVWLLVLMIIVGAATVFMSLSRGGMISMLMAGAFTTLIVAAKRSLKSRGWVMAVMALGAFICVLYIGFDAVYDRLAALRELHRYQDRWQILKDLSVSFRRFPVLGTGLGTHEVVYPMFDRSTIPALAAHAENEYAQTAEETGLIGLAALVGLGIIVWISYIHNIKRVSSPISSAAYGLGFGLLAIMLQSLSDFGQHIPANTMLSAVFCAMLMVMARIEGNSGRKKTPTASSGHKSLKVAVLFCILGVWMWTLLGAGRARLAERNWNKALAVEQKLMNKDWLGTKDEYLALTSDVAAAVDYEPDNVKYRHWLSVYNWRYLTPAADPNNTGGIPVTSQVIQFVQQIVKELNQARLLCPTYGATYCVLGQLEKFVLGDPNGAEHIQKGFQLAPSDPTACFVAGFMGATEGRIEDSYNKLKKAVQLDGRLFHDVAEIYINRVNRPDLAISIADDNVIWLSQMANILAEVQDDRDTAKQVRDKVTDLLKAKSEQPGTPAEAFAALANIYQKDKNVIKSAEYYRRALALDSKQVVLRLKLARLLAEAGLVSEAIDEARNCLRLQPQCEAAEKLIADLTVKHDALDKEL